MFVLSENSLEKLNGVHPKLVVFMEELIKESPYDFKITCGVRTAEEQNREYQKGRTLLYDGKGNKLSKVSWCDGYKLKSKHQVKVDGYSYRASWLKEQLHLHVGVYRYEQRYPRYAPLVYLSLIL